MDFEGPIADDSDHVDNDRDSIVDEPGEQIIMSKFVYYNNDFSNIGNPSTDFALLQLPAWYMERWI